MNDLEHAARRLIRLLESRSVPYAIVGGLAVRLYGLPRATYDVDFTVALTRDDLTNFYSAAMLEGFEIPEYQLAGWVDRVADMPLVKLRCPFEGRFIDIDTFLAESDFLKSILQRRRRHRAEALEAWFATVEDLVLMKLVANRNRDQGDIDDICLVQGRMDEAYLRRWADQLEIRKRLDEVLNRWNPDLE
jgi:hypothetical protein